MKKRKWYRSKRILPLLLSAVIVAEPLGMDLTVYAEEPSMIVETVEETEQEGDNLVEEEEGQTPSSENTDNMEGDENASEEPSESEGEQPDEEERPVEPEEPNEPEEPEEPSEPEEPTESIEPEEPTESADPEDPVEDEDISGETSETISGNELNEEEDEKPEDFVGMPENYKFSSEEMAWKKSLADYRDGIKEGQEGVDYAEGEVVTFADSEEEAEIIAQAYNAEIEKFSYGILTLKLGKDVPVERAVMAAADLEEKLPAVWPNYRRYLQEEADVLTEDTVQSMDGLEIQMTEYEADGGEVYSRTAAVTDPYLQPSSTYYQYQHTVVGSSYAWDAGYKGQGITVAVLDSGVAAHSDLPTVKSIYQQGNTDSHGHGTHVAGIIGARANGSLGVGIAPEATLISGNLGDIESDDIMAGIRAAIQNDADVINMSIGGPGKAPNEQIVVTEAYNAGVAIFAAASNDGGQNYSYPAAYDHVISVAATDATNERASFSNYNNMVDLSAPGVAIWSTGKDGSSYVGMSGTSMACPVAAGEAAVILSGNEALRNTDGGARVDKLQQLMKKNAIKAGSGMGAGITSLPKVFNLSTAAVKPKAPEITTQLAENKQSVKVNIQAQAGMRLCYTTNGKNPSYKNETPDANTTYVANNEVELTLDCTANAGSTVKAFAINESGVIGPVKSVKYTLSPYVTDIEISGSAKVEAGKSIQLKAVVTPKYATNKTITWSIVTSDDQAVDTTKIKIDQKGKVTTTETADLGQYKVTVTAKDDGHKKVEFPVEVVKAGTAIQNMAFSKTANKELWLTKTEAESRSLVPDLTVKEKNEAGELVDVNSSALQGRVIWTSNKPAIIAVDKTTGQITAKAVGSATITAKANDNSNKKATISITVKQAVTDIEITSDKGKKDTTFYVAAGKSIALKAVLMPQKPTNKKVEWSISPENKNVKINPSTGKVTVAAGTAAGKYTVTAKAADKKGATKTQDVQVFGGAIGGINLDVTKQTLYTQQISTEKTTTATIHATIKGERDNTDFNPEAYTVTSSNEKIVKATATSASGGKVDITVTATGNMYGKANVVIMATDGSNKKATCVVTVSGGINKVEMQDASGKKVSKLTLFRNGTVQGAPMQAELTALVQGTEGANLSAYEVESSNSKLVAATLDKTTKKITLTTGNSSTGKAKITLMATDGSKKKAVCTVTVCNPVSSISIAPASGNNNCVAQGKTLQLKAVASTEHGVISNKGVTWELYTTKPDTGAINQKVDAALARTLGVSISSSGKVKAARNAQLGAGGYPVRYVVKATAKDGSGITETYVVSVGNASKVISVKTTSGMLVLPSVIRLVETNPPETAYKYQVQSADLYQGGFSVSSSNPSVISATYAADTDADGNPYIDSGYVSVVAYKKGSATITIKAMDGSGNQFKIKFKSIR